MNKNIKQIISITLVLALIAGCFATLPLANATPEPVPGNPGWDKAYSGNTNIPQLSPSSGPSKDLPDNPRDNASGDKITSNAHSADYPGLYFYWDDKQKDDGVLLVNKVVFGLFKDGTFTLTAKNSNNYWGYTINQKTGFEVTSGVYAFRIPKQFQFINEKNGKNDKEDLKNINMVFIDGEYKSGYFVISKVFYNELGRVYGTGDNNKDWRGMIRESLELPGLYDLVSFTNIDYKIGTNEVKITDYKSAVYGKTVTVTENDIEGFLPREKSLQVTVTWNTLPTITFHNQKQWANIEIVKVWLDEDGDVMDAPDGVTVEFTINGAKAYLGPNKVKAGTYTVVETVVGDGFELVSAEEVVVTVAAGESEEAEFTNQKQRVVPNRASVLVEKVWAIAWDEPGYKNYPSVTFVDAISGESLGVGDTFNREGFDGVVSVSFSETVSQLVRNDGYTYTWKLVKIELLDGDTIIRTITGDDVADFDLKNGDNYVLKFYNELQREKKPVPPTIINDKIPSKEHVDKWWADFGILAYGASSNTDKDTYGFGFSEDFWDTYDSVTFGFGTQDKWTYIITVTREGDTLIATEANGASGFIFRDYVTGEGAVIVYDAHYTNGGASNVNFPVSIGANLDNPYGAGKMQLWLLTLQPKA